MAAEETFGRRDFLKRSAGIGVGVLGSSILFGCNPDWYNQMQVNEAEKESLLEKRICTSWKQIASLNIPRQHFGGVETEKGIILAFGGLDPEHNVLDSTEMYTPNTNNWVYIKQKLNVPRYYFRANWYW